MREKRYYKDMKGPQGKENEEKKKMLMREKNNKKTIDKMREKRYYKAMKETQEKEKERYPFLDVFPVKRKAQRAINERVGGFEEMNIELYEDGAVTEYVNMLECYFHGKSNSEPEEKKEQVREIIKEVFAGAGLEIKELKRRDYKTLFSVEGKTII